MFLPNLFINLFAFLLPNIVYQVWQEKLKIGNRPFRLLIMASTSVSIALCIIFPLFIEPSLAVEKWTIPLIIACLLGGKQVLPLIYSITLLLHVLIQPDKLVFSLLILLILLPFLLGFSRRFVTKSLQYRCMVVSSLNLIAVAVYVLFNNTAVLSLWQALPDIFLVIACSSLIVYLIERITRATMLREQYVNAEKMRVVSEMAASVSHEVRNPLTVSRGFLQLLMQMEQDERKIKYITMAISELDRAKEIITDYLTLAKPKSGTEMLLDLSEELTYIYNVITPYANLQLCQVSLELEKGLYILGDRTKLHQSLLNFCKNGIEAMTTNGQLSIQSQRLGELAVIRIGDNGVGLTPDQIASIGNPFYTTKEKGTGLGAMVSFRIIESMQGTVSIESQKGRGTTVWIRVPTVRPGNEEEAASAS